MRLDLSLFYTELSHLTSTHFGEGIVKSETFLPRFTRAVHPRDRGTLSELAGPGVVGSSGGLSDSR
jgi:hypothetical protein